MQTYKIPLVPGPTSVPNSILAAYQVDYAAADLEPEFLLLYQQVQKKLQQILDTKNDIVMMTGEAMVVLWGALKSCLQAGDKVLAVATGIFGYGIGEMARTITPNVEVVGFEYDQIADPARVAQAIQRFKPKMVTMVHCETPSGTLNPVEAVGRLIEKYDVPLFYVDAVASAGGVPLHVSDWNIDLCLVGTQKCLSAPPNWGILSVSPHAWEMIREVNYQGYDALAPFEKAVANKWFPYTPNWHALAMLNTACDRVLNIGLAKVFEFHAETAAYCRERIGKMGLRLFPQKAVFCSPTVTTVSLPERIAWPQLDRLLRQHGMAVGGSLEPLAGKIFRIGHMGSQADHRLVQQGMDILESVLRKV